MSCALPVLGKGRGQEEFIKPCVGHVVENQAVMVLLECCIWWIREQERGH